jgi:signal transduction histidine kinase
MVLFRWVNLTIIVVWIHAFGCTGADKKPQPRAVKGFLDLSHWDFEKDGPVSLEGEWLFYPTYLDIMAGEANDPSKFGLAHVPGTGNPEMMKGQPPAGATTWVVHVKLPEHSRDLAIEDKPGWANRNSYIRLADSPSWMPIKVRNNDWPKTESYDFDDWVSVVKPIHQHSSTISIAMVKMSRAALPLDPPTVGSIEALIGQIKNTSIKQYLILGSFLTLGILCLGLFVQRPEDSLYAYAGIICLSFGVRYFGSERLMIDFVSSSGFFASYAHFISLILFAMGSSALVYYLAAIGISLTQTFRERMCYRGIQVCAVLHTLIIVSFHLSVDLHFFYASKLFQPQWFVFNIVVITLLGLLLVEIKRIGKWAYYLGVGISAYVFGTVWDAVILGLQKDWWIAHFCNLVFCGALTLMLGRRFAITYEENHRLLDEVQQKEKARTVFFHNSSHELRTPLNGIIGFLQLLQQGRYGQLPVTASQQIDKCIRLALGLKNQVNTILDLAKSRKGLLTLTHTLTDLNDIVQEARDLATGLELKRENCSFSWDKNWEDKDRTFVSDREKLSTIIRNLLGNAFKFADPHRPNHVHLSLVRNAEGLTITVQDTGIGIPADHKDRIFEEFEQVTGDARRAYEGTGLGLTMVRDIVHLMKGTIEVESEMGVGSLFRVSIPEAKDLQIQQVVDITPTTMAHLQTQALSSSSPSVDSTQPDTSPQNHHHVLIVDDHQINCELLSDLLADEGYRISIAFGGEEALKKMKIEHPDVVLLDMMMPYVSGEDVIRAMQQDTDLQDIPVILVTARASEDDRLFGLSLGADDYLAKPIHHEELKFRVKNLLHRLELKQRLVTVEEREKMAQLGQLMRELGHELKNAFQQDQRPDLDRQGAEQILRRLPLDPALWLQAVQAFVTQQLIPLSQLELDLLPFTQPEQKSSVDLRYIRLVLSQLALDAPHRSQLWAFLLSLPPERHQEIHHTFRILRNLVSLQEQTRYANDLIMNILEYSRQSQDARVCSLQDVLPRVLGLVQGRINRLGIKVTTKSLEVGLCISPSALMQILLNLTVNACDALEQISGSDRWMHYEAQRVGATIQIHVSNAGQAFSVEMAKSLFTEQGSTKGHKGYGLGLGISKRVALRHHGSLEIAPGAAHPEFVLTLPAQEPNHVDQAA